MRTTSDHLPKTHQVNIRMTDDEHQLIIDKAREYGVPISTYLRLILRLGKIPKPVAR